MRVRIQDANGDMTFGRGSLNYYINQPVGVAQLCQTRLLLFTKEWFLNTADGTPWIGSILGANTQLSKDLAIQTRILATPGVVSISNYSSTVTNRNLVVQCLLNTLYGQTPFVVTL